ncbi:type I polyketide synthase [Streptomyces sp. ISL-11]|uniref:type I polyketide synthase n=1 Tax=Streptomyces sp. ISL-11 TaxID=2819174 RepID=UPI001BEC920E|nr:type I polyketide synthase [Streptomyces sp. ISL-11]MBT2384962.1 SDR family NAD(P)-dependent oxidoreductase [Streptomyces sp. ISL-11]
MKVNEFSGREIAVLGMSGRFPGAGSVGELWGLLMEGRDGISTAPPERGWMHDLYDPVPGAPGKLPTVRGGFLAGLDRFDPGFFDISPREARRIDPQQRLLLETSTEAAQDAQIPVAELSRARTGVFVGAFSGDYWLRQIGDLEGLDLLALQGGTHSALHGRIAYALDLRGPSLTIDTACSSSLVAIHTACQSLRLGECDYALAGGSHLLLAPYNSVALARAGALGPDGRSKFADASANGYVQSEAVGVVLLKPLARALADGDRVRAVILGGAVGGSGFTGQGMIAPTVSSQETILRLACRAAGVDPRGISLVEAHGPGTPAGDPVELEALARVLGPRPDTEPCLVGSVKTAIGHCEGAAGVAGFIKAVLCLEHRLMPGNTQLRRLHPKIDWDTAPLHLPRSVTPLPTGRRTPLAGVTSFGASGVGAHLVLSAAPDSAAAAAPRPPGALLLPVSARSEDALRALAAGYSRLLADIPAASAADVCAAAATGRDHYEHRLAVTAATPERLAASLRAHLATEESAGVFTSDGGVWSAPRVVFVFPGQGSQWAGMGHTLLDRNAAFTETLEQCDAVIRRHAGWSLRAALEQGDEEWLGRTSSIQPALWAIGVSLASLWQSWGISPDAVVGHSQGEIAAAHVAGALTLEEAGRISCLRARLIEELAQPGALCWLQLPAGEAAELVAELGVDAQTAVEESATSSVLAGTPQAIDVLVEACEQRNISCMPVPVDYAAHSPSVDPVRRPLQQQLADLRPRATAVPFLSTVTGTQLPGTALDASYWWRNLREPVLLKSTISTQLRDQQRTVFLQISAHPVLSAALRGDNALPLASLRRDQDEMTTLYSALAALYTAGVNPDWKQVVGPPPARVPLPLYPWQRSRYWHQSEDFSWPAIETDPPEVTVTDPAAPPVIPHTPPSPATEEEPAHDTVLSLSRTVDTDEYTMLLGHRVAGRPVVPGAFFLELALAAAKKAGCPTDLCDITFQEVLLLDDDARGSLSLRVQEVAPGSSRLTIDSRAEPAAAWKTHVSLRLPSDPAAAPSTRVDLDSLLQRCPAWQAGEHFYRDRLAEGNDWRGPFRCMAEIHRGRDEALVRLRPVNDEFHLIHPGALDGCLQAAFASLTHENSPQRGFLLASVDRLSLYQEPDVRGLWVHAVRNDASAVGQLCVDLTVFDEHGTLIAEISGVRGKTLAADSPQTSAPPASSPWLQVRWETVPFAPATANGTGNWLLIGGTPPLDRALHTSLVRRGNTVQSVQAGSYQVVAPGRYRADLTSPQDLAKVMREASRGAPLTGIVHLGALGGATAADASPREVQWVTTDLCAGLLSVARAVASAELPQPPRLFVLTRGAQAAVDADAVPAPWQAALWPLAQTISLEMGQCPTVLVDLDSNEPEDEADPLGPLLRAAGAEDRMALRGTNVYAPRLTAAARQPSLPSLPSQDVTLCTSGGIDGITLEPLTARPRPGAGEVGIAVTHTALNYRDVLQTVGMLAGHQQVLTACECAGTVVDIGEGVEGLQPGDEVMSYMYSPPASYAVVSAACVVKRPQGLTPAEAAAVPVVYGSAYQGLIETARLQPGQRVLIHSASGGLGMAALEIARWRGAVVYATAGTEAKRDLLLKLGAAKVADSRSTDFAHELRDPDGRGVDVILNTLAGPDAMQANFELLSPFGHYVEAACTEAHSGHIPARLLLPKRSYHVMDLAAVHEHDPNILGNTLRHVGSLLTRQEWSPPRVTVFEAEKAGDAMRLMARAAHTGKLVLRFPDLSSRCATVRPDVTYLVVGGLSGIGALFAQWLAAQGATHLLITGRSDISSTDPTDPRARLLRSLSDRPELSVQYAAVDVADEPAMKRVLRERAQQGLPAVAGVVHSALTLDPRPLVDLSDENLDRTLRPKVAGGWVLHRLFADEGLDFFVLFSSALSLLSGLRIGSQVGAYAAANGFLDALAVHRRAAGLPATVVNWGYWSETGMAHRLSEKNGRSVRPDGIGALHPAQAPDLFSAVLAADADLCCLPADWPAYIEAAPQDAAAPILSTLLGRHATASLHAPGERTRPDTTDRHPPQPELEPAPRPAAITPAPPTPPDSAPTPPAQPLPSQNNGSSADPRPQPVPAHTASVLEQWLIQQVARVLDMSAGDVDPSRPVNRLGIDSLLAAEITTRLRTAHGHDITVPRVLKAPSLHALATELAAEPRTQT